MTKLIYAQYGKKIQGRKGVTRHKISCIGFNSLKLIVQYVDNIMFIKIFMSKRITLWDDGVMVQDLISQ
jgi:hypothetical protein